MSIGLLLFWAAVGWCGTPWRWPVPPPLPDPRWFIDRIIGIIGGLIGGWLFVQAWPIPQTEAGTGLLVAASGVGALVGSLISLDLSGLVRGRRGAQVAAGTSSQR